jgi:hypothetical protein
MWRHICLATAEEIRDLADDMQIICDEYGFETCIAPTEEIHLLVFDMQPICAEYNSRHLKKFVYWRSAFSLSVMNMAKKHDSR